MKPEISHEVRQLPERVYLVFDDWRLPRSAPRWLDWLTRPGFRHCYILQPEGDVTLIFNPLATSILLEFAEFPARLCADACLGQGMRVLAVAPRFIPDYIPRGLLTCVSACKAALGVNAWHVITPYQLYRHLLAHGAEELRT